MPRAAFRLPAVRDVVVVLAGVVAFGVFSRAPWKQLPGLLESAGLRLPLALLAWPVALAFDAWAWRVLLRGVGAREATWARLWLIRVVSEAVLLSLPGGSVLAEVLKIGLLCRAHPSLSVAAVAATVVVKKVLVIGTETPYLVLAAGVAEARALDAQWIALPLVAAALAVAVAFALGRASVGTRWAARLAGAADSVRARGGVFATVAAQLGELRGAERDALGLWRQPRRLVVVCVALVAAWLCEGTDLWLASWALGAPLTVWQAIYCDACAGFVRAAAFAVPGGWGAQDAGLVVLLEAIAGRAEGAAVSVAVMKRAKEVFFVVTGCSLGLAIKASWRKHRRERTPRVER